ncbi:MAG TPA: acyl-CoA dehydrogenase family protein, partial [Sedimentisphaerales bacterium]|nr:acyl-CoA dehydrogenase family protein [Sedimentisphaerales bacterium]
PGPTVHVRRLEDKLGIHGSPTCEICFDNTPCQLIGERQRGLVTYVMSLMNGARIGIAAQSMGIGEAAYRIARDYAASRKQFGVAIERLPAVRDLLIEMKMLIEACRAMLYETCRVVDVDRYYERMLASGPIADKERLKTIKNESRMYSRLAAMLTPMSKYICSEMCNKVAYDSIQVLGGSGYMRDYASERHARDARITTIYEGTSQLQVVAAVRGVCSGTAEKYLEELAGRQYEAQFKDLLAVLVQGHATMKQCVMAVKERGVEYMDLWGRPLVDIAMDLINGYLLLGLASAKVDMMVPAIEGEGLGTSSMKKRKAAMARRFITRNAALIEARAKLICSGDTSTMSEYGLVVGPVQTEL